MDNKICELPQSPDCPKLRVLLLQGNTDLTDIPDSFFDHMPLLQHLDLSYTNIRDLPPSISKLIELKKFYLRGCDLFMELPPEIGQLRNLEELDLDGTLITHLPKEIQELINLRSLTLCFEGYHQVPGYDKKGKQISNSTIVPLGVISNLTQLNYLSINIDPEDERWNKNILSILPEILGLKNLWRVSIYVPKAEFLELIPSHKSLDFRLVVGQHMRRFISRVTLEMEEKFKHCDRSIKFVNGVNVPNGVKMNLWRFRALYLDRHVTIKSLSEFQLKNLDMLQVCILAECNEMETAVEGSYLDEEFKKHALRNLKFLSVFYMKNLRSIYEGTTPGFHCLKYIALHTCPMLTTIFTSSFIRNLSLLEELIVEDCPKVATLIRHDSLEHETHIFLPRLRTIALLYLPELVNIFNGLHAGHGLEKMEFYYCPKLQRLSKMELSSKSLRVIKGERKWWEALKWNEDEWGCEGRPNFLNLIFSPINEEADVMIQPSTHDDKDQVNEEVEEVMRHCLPHLITMPPSLRIQALQQPSSSQLMFNKKISLPIFTGSRILDMGGDTIQVVLVDKSGDQMVPTSLPHPIKLEIVVLDGDFPPGDKESWTSEEFNSHIVKERTGKRPLLTGELNLTMRDGIAPIGDIEFTDNSSWIRSRKFRVAVRVAPGSNLSVRIREGMTDPFIVKDHRGELYKKHHPPMLNDEVWRLEKIGKDGAFHKKLSTEGINTVQDFLKLSVVDPLRLRKILGIGMSEKMWDVTIKHAKTCNMGNKLYVYRGTHFTIFLNAICQLVRADINGQSFPGRELSNMNRSYIEKLVREAFGRWNDLEEIDGVLNDNVALLTQGETVEKFPNNNQALTIAYDQNDYFVDNKPTEACNYVPSHNAQTVGSEWGMNETFATASFVNSIPYSFSESQSDGDITPGSGSVIDGGSRWH